MISTKMITAINEQINKELFSEYLYISIQAWFADQNLDGMANWMSAQAQEEHFHAMKFFNYLIERGARVKLKAIEGPAVDFKTPLKAFQESLDHEKFISKSIDELMDLAIKEKDHATKSFLQWFIDEQVEEESSVDRIVNMLKMVGDHGHGIMMIDRELAQRTFVPENEA
ncbi:MAG: ferritin [Candidatus Cloacimonetes bacterium]|nr:ferritin [Candidatus Cloacimonadota bacterium]MCB5286366.1 ferritin [Candidatus Cloacimonadota bacterium]MCK9184004.1 ferritin [Candidatus Cloacimonadota bacterium]MCK9585030.1 ferritin [Candidatus Cloacimonadota bacterium]MDY0228688.1 ferritin [Candidatus Cloacimonadaceae bacterium]